MNSSIEDVKNSVSLVIWHSSPSSSVGAASVKVLFLLARLRQRKITYRPFQTLSQE